MNATYFNTQFRLFSPVVEWPRCFAIASAYATTGQQGSKHDNKRADEALGRELQSRCSWYVRLIGFALDGDYEEPCWAFELPFDQACELGLRYRQEALYMVQDDLLFVSYCDDRRALVPVGPFHERIHPVSVCSRNEAAMARTPSPVAEHEQMRAAS